MAKSKKIDTLEKLIDQTLNCVSLSFNDGKIKFYIEVDKCDMQDDEWEEVIPKTNKKDFIKDVRRTIQRVANTEPAGVRVLIFNENEKVVFNKCCKLIEKYVPLVDGEDKEDKKNAFTIFDSGDTYNGLGQLGMLTIQSQQKDYERQLEILRNKYENDIQFLRFTTQTENNKLAEENKKLKEEYDKLKKDNDKLDKDLGTISDAYENLKNSTTASNLKGIMALAGDFLQNKGYDMRGLQGWVSSPDNIGNLTQGEQQMEQPEYEQRLPQTQVYEADDDYSPQLPEIEYSETTLQLAQWIDNAVEPYKSQTIAILQQIAYRPTRAKKILDFLTFDGINKQQKQQTNYTPTATANNDEYDENDSDIADYYENRNEMNEQKKNN